MPVNVVRSIEDEIAWERAKEAARQQYPDAERYKQSFKSARRRD